MSKNNENVPILHLPQLADLEKKIDIILKEIRKKQPNELEDYVSKEDFMKKFSIKSGMFYTILNKGVLEPYRINRKIYLRISEVDEALREGLLK